MKKIPDTRLRQRYKMLTSISTKDRSNLCAQLAENPRGLVEEFCEAIRLVDTSYKNTEQSFHPGGRKIDPVPRGGRMYMALFKEGPLTVPGADGYSFRIKDYEIGPLRATGAGAKMSGAGGIDYVALSEGMPRIPILGEMKVKDDKDTFYALVQLLCYLSEMSSKSQVDRSNRWLFGGELGYPVRWDIHILLCDFNDRGTKGPMIDQTHRLAMAFRQGLDEHTDVSPVLGRILCLRFRKSQSDRALDLIWRC